MEGFKKYVLDKIEFALENQYGLRREHDVTFPWNEGYTEALEDILHHIEQYNEE
jgi:hypothetical protein